MKEGVDALIRAGNLDAEGAKRIQAYIFAMHAWKVESVTERLAVARQAFSELQNDDERRLANVIWHIEDKRVRAMQPKREIV
jgi:hypothetical protein